MSNIVAIMSMSLDGYVADLNDGVADVFDWLLTVGQYRGLQKLGTFDTKTSSSVRTPARLRKLGGAIFCDRRYDTVFVYHNGAESYYAAQGFRGLLKV